ncbi:MAG: hypothetical protein MI922_13925 [Bacteroidales bacterium]|nr:hypothetical protein [Bacteroidales bacterium]
MIGLCRRRINKSLISILFGLLIVLQVTNKTVYTHAHVYNDGSVVTHAHPYSKNTDSNPFKKHHHSDSELIVLEQLDLLIIGGLLPFLFIVASIFFKHYIPQNKKYSYALLLLQAARAPPLACCK